LDKEQNLESEYALKLEKEIATLIRQINALEAEFEKTKPYLEI